MMVWCIDRHPTPGGFGSQLDDGFGVAYFQTVNAYSCYAISTTKSSGVTAVEFSDKLWDVLVEMRQMFEPEYKCDFHSGDLIQSSR